MTIALTLHNDNTPVLCDLSDVGEGAREEEAREPEARAKHRLSARVRILASLIMLALWFVEG